MVKKQFDELLKKMEGESPQVYKICPKCVFEKREAFYNHPYEKLSKKQYHENEDLIDLESMFPAALRTWNRYCPAHQSERVKDVSTIVCKRIIPVDWFDVFDKDGYHVCRSCGAELLTKKGKHCAAQRWCRRTDPEHRAWVSETIWNWASVRDDYVFTLAKNQVELIRAKHAGMIEKEELKLNDGRKNGGSLVFWEWNGLTVIKCEKCGELATIDASWHSQLPQAQVHHVEPVCLVNETNVMSIFDKKNLICLCLKCHGQSHPWRARPKPEPIRYVTLDKFM